MNPIARGGLTIQRDALEAAVAAQQQRTSVAREGIARHQILPALRLALVVLDREGNPAVLAGGERAQAQTGLALLAGGVGQLLAVRRELRSEIGTGKRPAPRDTGHWQDRLFPAGGQVASHDRPQLQLGTVLVAAAARCIELLAIWRHHRAQRALVAAGALRADRCDQAFAAIQSVTPQLVIVDRPAEAAGVQGAAIGRPGRRHQHGIVVAERELLRIAAIGPHAPQVFRTAAVADKGDPVSVRRKRRLAVEAQAAADRLGPAAVGVQRVQIAEQVEHQPAITRRHVQPHPGAFIGLEGDAARGAQWQRLSRRLLRARHAGRRGCTCSIGQPRQRQVLGGIVGQRGSRGDR